MNRDFKDCLDKKRLYKSEGATALAEKEFRSASDDLDNAGFSLSKKRYKWATIQAYYAMFHGARALLYSKGYRERGHYCTVVGVEELFGKAGLLEMKWVRALRNAMSMREDADYASEFSKEGAEVTVKNAEGFLEEAERLLKKGK
ncbi:MAG: HEPN domain-containing protein [Thermodesulfobacteriota bacterium]